MEEVKISRILTGVKSTGAPHLGNYLGAIRPSLELTQSIEGESFLFIADYHSMTGNITSEELLKSTYDVAASWLACGVDPKKSIFYRQSDIPEIFELSWILSCLCAKGLMNRAHAYKAKVSENKEYGKDDLDFGINMGLYSYPILMSADILLFSASHVPVGEDQIQHVEIARDLAVKFNFQYKTDFVRVPQFIVQKELKTIPGLDGRKMSKSYNNSIPIFCDEKKLRKLVMKIKTDSLPPESPKDPDNSLIFDLYKYFASEDEISNFKKQFEAGIGWGYAKEHLFEVINRELKLKRENYNNWINNKHEVDKVLKLGSEMAREIAQNNIKEIRKLIGISN